MAGLSSYLSDTTTKATNLPSWYDQAQQANVKAAQAGAAGMPTLQNTVAGGAINALADPNNAMVQGSKTAQQIATGAANPWNVSATGQVTPNTNTAMGGLFQAQNQQLNQLLPNAMAPAQASGIASGNFGSLRNNTAIDKAKGDAFANLNAAQMQAALTNQQTGVNASTAAGNLANQNITSQSAMGQLQQADPMKASTALNNILANTKTGASVTESTQMSPLSQIGSLSQLFGSTGAVNSLLGSLGVKGGLNGLFTSAGNALGGLGTSDATNAARAASGTAGINDVGTPVEPLADPSMPTNSDGTIDNSGGGWGTGGGTDWANTASGGQVNNGFDFTTQ